MTAIILAESSLELIPESMHNHPSVTSYSKKFKKDSSNTLLDNSWHFAAMKGIENEIKRGRPDLIHLTLLSICTTPAFYNGKIDLYIHTVNDNVIWLSHDIRLPKSYHRFQGVMEQLFIQKKIRSADDDQPLMIIEDLTISELISKIRPTQIIGLTTKGRNTTFELLAKQITQTTCIIIGGFQKGHFSKETEDILDPDKVFAVDQSSLEGHVVASRLVYEYEKTIFI